MDRSKCTTFQSYNTHIPEGGLQASCKQASNRMIRTKLLAVTCIIVCVQGILAGTKYHYVSEIYTVCATGIPI